MNPRLKGETWGTRLKAAKSRLAKKRSAEKRLAESEGASDC